MTVTKKFILAILLGFVLVNSSIIQLESNSHGTLNFGQGQTNTDNPDGSRNPDGSNSRRNQKNPNILGTANLNANSHAADPSEQEKKNRTNMLFDDFKKQFGKKYYTSEESKKKQNFGRNIANLAKSDCWPCGVTEMFDRSPEDIAALNGLLQGPSREYQITTDAPLLSGSSRTSGSSSTSGSTSNSNSIILGATPTSFDWRTYGAVTPIRDQGQCGSCWAFAATAFLESEGIRRKKFTNTINLSEHFLLQCTANGGYKCNGGDPMRAVTKGITPGMPLESTYPYKPGYDYTSTICTAPLTGATFSTTGTVSYYSSYSTKSADSTMITYLLQRPLVIAVNANDWGNYKPVLTGTIDQKTFFCSTSNSAGGLNHAVLLIGYTSKAWLIKNSWNTWWGDKGYIWVTRDRTRNCGIGLYWGTVSSTLTPVV